MYSLVGHDKDGDIYHVVSRFASLEKAVSYAESLRPMLKADELRYMDEPLDWLEIYFNWGLPDEAMVWASYAPQ